MPLTFGRESLQATSKTQGDFNLQNRFSMEVDGVSVTGGSQAESDALASSIEDESDISEYKSGQTTVIRPRPRPIVLRMALTPEQSRAVFHHTGKWVQEFAFTRHALKVLAARARFGLSACWTQDKRAA